MVPWEWEPIGNRPNWNMHWSNRQTCMSYGSCLSVGRRWKVLAEQHILVGSFHDMIDMYVYITLYQHDFHHVSSSFIHHHPKCLTSTNHDMWSDLGMARDLPHDLLRTWGPTWPAGVGKSPTSTRSLRNPQNILLYPFHSVDGCEITTRWFIRLSQYL